MMTLHTYLRWPLLLLSLCFSGCSLLTPQGGQQALQQQLGTLHHWQLRGKLSVTSPQDSVTGYLTWEQNNRDYQLFITGPFGQGSTRLMGSANTATLLLPGWQQPQTASSAEQLMATHLGWNFPVTDIRHWIKGQPAPGQPAISKFDESGLLQQLNQHGWQIGYSRYRLHQGFWLPGLVKVQGHDFRFVLSIKEWTIHD